MQADPATRTARCSRSKRLDFITADRGSNNHDGSGIEAAPLDQLANGAVDTGTETIIVGAQPDAARRGVVHSAAVRSLALSSGRALLTVFSHEIDRTGFQLRKNLPD